MKIRIKSIIHIFVTAFLIICSQHDIFSQEADSIRINKPGLFVGISFGPSQTHITNEGIFSVADLYSDKQNAFGGSLEIGYFFSKSIGVSSGIGYSSYKTQLSLANYQSEFNSVDSENEAYERQVTGIDISEVQKVGFLSIPVCLNIRLPINRTIDFSLQTGINMAVALNKTYTSSGTFTYKGYYPAYNVLLENLPAYGFPTNFQSNSGGELDIKPLVFNVLIAAGFDFFVQKNIQIGVSACYTKSLSNISAYTSPEKFQLSSDVNQINSLMGGSSKATLESLGLNIKLRYFLNR